jgi:hypothetical protein
MKRLLCFVAPAVAALLTLTDATHAESGYRPPFQPGNLYGAPMCSFIPDNPQSAPSQPSASYVPITERMPCALANETVADRITAGS